MAYSVDANVVIIGCGIAGVGAAHRLIKAGFNHVRILEATSRCGGRIKTNHFGKIITEIGATYIHGPSVKNPVFCLARDYDLLAPVALTPENQAVDVDEYPPWIPNWFSSSGEKLSAESMSPAFELFRELLDKTWQFKNRKEKLGTSVGHFIQSEANKQVPKRWKDKDDPTKKLLQCGISTMLKAECCSSATHSMDDIDLVGFSMYKSIKGVDCTFPNGYEGLIRHMMSDLPGDLVTYNRPVRCIHWNNTKHGEHLVSVECEDGEMIGADHVILTVPLGYLKKHHSTLFSPALPPPKLHSIYQLGFGTCDKIYIEFESPWWDPDCNVIYLVWKDEDQISDQVADETKSWIRKIPMFTVIKPSDKNSHILCGWITGLEAEYMETLPEDEIRRSITELVCTFTGKCTIVPKRILCSRWFNDPWTLGSYSYPARGCTAKDIENMMKPLPMKGKSRQPLQVLFAGEATHPCYYSTVHGALLTGWREADRLISHHYSVHPSDQSES